jgi:hypothetical protein
LLFYLSAISATIFLKSIAAHGLLRNHHCNINADAPYRVHGTPAKYISHRVKVYPLYNLHAGQCRLALSFCAVINAVAQRSLLPIQYLFVTVRPTTRRHIV